MQDKAIKLSLFINYFVFAILLNSVGIVILKSQNVYGVDEVAASTLELFKDLPIAIVSFLVASFLPRIGYKKAMLAALAIVTVACICMYFGNSFWSAKMLFASVGDSFALIKVSVYSVIGLVTDGDADRIGLMDGEGEFIDSHHIILLLVHYLVKYKKMNGMISTKKRKSLYRSKSLVKRKNA